jgi:hypothetical protein
VVGEHQVLGHGDLSAQRCPHREEVARGRDVVDAQEVSPVVQPVRDGGKGAPEALARRSQGESANEVLARHCQQHGQAQRLDLAEAPQQLDRLRGVFAEIRAGAYQQPLVRDAGGPRDLEALS